MTDKQDLIAHAARLLREAAEELRQAHAYNNSEGWENETDAKDAYDEHLAAAQALEDWEQAVGAGGVQALSAAPAGWKPVPEDATEEMVRATDKVNFANADTDGTMHNVWNVMLAASPTPPAEQPATTTKAATPKAGATTGAALGILGIEQAVPKAAPGELNAYPMAGNEDVSALGPWQSGTDKPSMDGTYLREFDEGEGTSEFHQGVWLRDGFFPSDLQDVRWRGRAAPQQEATKAAPGEPYDDSTPHLSVGDSSFESWFSSYCPANKGDKQRARDAYAAGTGDPLVVAATQQRVSDECFPGEPRVAVPQGLIGAACSAIRNKRDGGNVLEQLRRYTVGDLSRQLAPQQEAQEPGEIPESIERMATDRYKVVPSHESMFHRWAVVAGSGTQQLYLGREVECQNMARKFSGAFLDGAFVTMQSTSPNPAPAPLSDDSAMLDWIAIHGSFGVDSSTGEVGGNGQKRVAATRKNIRAALAAQGGTL